MLSKEQNKRFTEVGPGTPMGELLRRYWMPFATVKQLEEHPTRAITLLGEHLVAFKDRSGKYGLIQEYCPHRNTNLLWGIPEQEGLRDIGWAVLPCNWLQIMENSLDPVHVEHLHQYFSNYVLERLGRLDEG